MTTGVTFTRQALVTLLTGALLTLSMPVSPAYAESEAPTLYEQGVEQYRNGHYEKALKLFKQVVANAPDSTEGRYYYAITLAQLGRFNEARTAYQEVIRLEPESEAAALARQGIDFLPSPQQLDAPPQFQAPAASGRPPIPSASAYVQSNLSQGMQPPGQQPQASANSPFGQMDPQALQMMMLMGSMGGGGGGGFNPMMIPLLQTMGRGNGEGGDPQNTIPPDVLSTMMMNQMMQDFSFGSKNDD